MAGILPVICKLLIYFLGLELSFAGRYSNVFELFLLVIFIPASIYLTRNMEKRGYITFEDAFKTGLKTTAIAAVIISGFTFVYFKYIDHSIVEQMLDKVREQSGNKKEETEKALEAVKHYFSPFFQCTSALFGNMVAGSFVSIVSSFLLRKDAPFEDGFGLN